MVSYLKSSIHWSEAECNAITRFDVPFFSSELRDSITQSLVKRSDWRKWKSKQFNRPVKTTGHNCLNHSLKAEVTAVEKGCFIAACFRLSGWTWGAGPSRVEFMLKGNEAQSIQHVALSQSLGALFFFAFLLLAPVIVMQMIAILLN